MELADWSAPIEKQTEINNLNSSPQGQLALQQGRANLELTQGQVKGNQLDLQAKEMQKKAFSDYMARQAQGVKAGEAKQGQGDRENSEVNLLQDDIDRSRDLAEMYMAGGATEKATALYTKISMDSQRLEKLKSAPLERAEKQNTLVKSWSEKLEKVAGAALTGGPKGVAYFINQRDAIKQEMQQAGIKNDPIMDAIFNMPPTPDNLRRLQMTIATVKEQLGKNSTALAGNAIGKLDARTGLLIGGQARQSESIRQADEKISAKRQNDNGAEATDSIDVEKMWGPDWKNLTKDEQTLMKNTVGKAYRDAKGSLNRTASPDDIKKIAIASGKEEMGKFKSANERAKDALKTPDMLARDKELGMGRGTRPAETPLDQKSAVDLAKGTQKPTKFEEENDLPPGSEAKVMDFAIKKQQAMTSTGAKDDKPRLGGQDYVQMAMQIRNGEKESDVMKDLSRADAAGVKATLNMMERDIGPRTEYAVGAYSQRYAQNMTRAGNEVFRNVKSQVKLGTGLTAGVLSNVADGGTGVLGALAGLVKAGSTNVTDNDEQMYHSVAGYMAREIALVANNGAAPNTADVKKYQDLFEAPSGTPNDVALYKLLTAIDFVRTGLKTGAPANRKDEIQRRESLKQLNRFPSPDDFSDAMKKSGKPIAAASQVRSKLESMFNSDKSKPTSFSSEAEAEKAGLPPGTPVIINGVKGTWQ